MDSFEELRGVPNEVSVHFASVLSGRGRTAVAAGWDENCRSHSSPGQVQGALRSKLTYALTLKT